MPICHLLTNESTEDVAIHILRSQKTTPPPQCDSSGALHESDVKNVSHQRKGGKSSL